MTTKAATMSLRLPVSLKAALEKVAAADGSSMNQFLVMAAAEKLAAIQTAESFFAERRERGDVEKALAFLSRKGGEATRPGDEMPV
jgi:uncharacterized protein (DUF1778 family)